MDSQISKSAACLRIIKKTRKGRDGGGGGGGGDGSGGGGGGGGDGGAAERAVSLREPNPTKKVKNVAELQRRKKSLEVGMTQISKTEKEHKWESKQGKKRGKDERMKKEMEGRRKGH